MSMPVINVDVVRRLPNLIAQGFYVVHYISLSGFSAVKSYNPGTSRALRFPPTLSSARCLLDSPHMSAERDPDAALMLLVKQGDNAAFALLVDKYKQPIMNLAYRMLRDLTEAEDLAQNVFIQVHKSAARYEVCSKFSTWLFTIARNLCLNEIRRRSRHPAESIEAPYYEQEDQPRQQFEDKKVTSP